MDPDTIDRLAAQLGAHAHHPASIGAVMRWRAARCVVCNLPFPTWDAWGDRHDTDAGPAHPTCCQNCEVTS